VIDDLESWQAIFDASWFLVMMLANSLIDDELDRGYPRYTSFSSAYNFRDALKDVPQIKASLFFPEYRLNSARTLDIPFSSAKTVPRAGSEKWVILDSIHCDPHANVSLLTKDIQDLV
jgi:hypothetical protein